MAEKYWVPAIERTNLVINLIAKEPGKHKLIDLSKALNINKSTMFSLLNTLEVLGWVVKGNGDTYKLGPTLGSYSAAYFRQFNILQSFYLEAAKSVDKIHETIQLGILQGTNVVYLAKEESKSRVRLVTDPGMQFPAHASAIGKIQLIQYDYDELNNLYPDDHLFQLTPRTLKNVEELWKELESAKKTGYICEEQEGTDEFYCVAAPIYNHENELIAGVSFAMLEHSWKEKKERAIAEIIDLGRRLSIQSGCVDYN
ncbi:IclR family transcriptional regulator [Evansella sp. AB-P1]|uniref:IclR family transcriptional regulator n=1 Tax=Evansella sp. AB-P1 TaxID=3037653 RepID=UPI00241FF4DE|nr:IclR family transcriptional regulator [Evansella sp. AB-P1]MDG5789636.1 IclR family transcriptional regulator [Evansella sp. AB-P1]